jgi:hypothetical protein
MTDQPSNYDRGVDNLNEAQEGAPALMAERLVTAQTYALLAVADELRALRELLAERLTKPQPVYYRLGADGTHIYEGLWDDWLSIRWVLARRWFRKTEAL